METSEIQEILDSVEEGEAVKDIGTLTHELTMVILTQAMDRNICPVRMKNRNISPMMLAGQLVREIQKLLNS